MTEQKTADQRKAILSQTIQNEVAKGNSRIETRGDYDAVIVRGRKINIPTWVHVILTLVSVGLWIPVWILHAIFDREKRVSISVDEYGATNIQNLN